MKKSLILSLLFILTSVLFSMTEEEAEEIAERKSIYRKLDNLNSKSPGYFEIIFPSGGPYIQNKTLDVIKSWNKDRGYNYEIEVFLYAGSGKCVYALTDEIELLRVKCRELNSGNTKSTNIKKSKYINK